MIQTLKKNILNNHKERQAKFKKIETDLRAAQDQATLGKLQQYQEARDKLIEEEKYESLVNQLEQAVNDESNPAREGGPMTTISDAGNSSST